MKELNAAEQLHALWLAYDTRIDYFSACVIEVGRPQECPVGTPARRRKRKPRRTWRAKLEAHAFWNRFGVALFGVQPKYRMRRHAAEIAMAEIDAAIDAEIAALLA